MDLIIYCVIISAMMVRFLTRRFIGEYDPDLGKILYNNSIHFNENSINLNNISCNWNNTSINYIFVYSWIIVKKCNLSYFTHSLTSLSTSVSYLLIIKYVSLFTLLEFLMFLCRNHPSPASSYRKYNTCSWSERHCRRGNEIIFFISY